MNGLQRNGETLGAPGFTDRVKNKGAITETF